MTDEDDILDGQYLLQRLSVALDATRQGAPTKPISVTLPQPLADAFRLLANAGIIENVSTAVARALEDVLQAHVVALRLDEVRATNPDDMPTDTEVAEMAARMNP